MDGQDEITDAHENFVNPLRILHRSSGITICHLLLALEMFSVCVNSSS